MFLTLDVKLFGSLDTKTINNCEKFRRNVSKYSFTKSKLVIFS